MNKQRVVCPDCGSKDLAPPDDDGWQYCNACGTDLAPDHEEGSG